MVMPTKSRLKLFIFFSCFALSLHAAEEEKPQTNHGIVIDFGGLLSKKGPKIDVKVSRNKLAVNSSKITSVISHIKNFKEKREAFDSHRRAFKEYASSLNRHVPDFHYESVKEKFLETLVELE